MAYKIEEIEGIGPAYKEKLTTVKIATTDDLLEMCCNPEGRKAVAEKTGLPLDKAQGAIDAVMDFLNEKLPAPIASQIEKFMGGDGDEEGGLTDKLGGMFGKKD